MPFFSDRRALLVFFNEQATQYLRRSAGAAVIGLFVAVLLSCFHDTPPVLQAERMGSDAAMRLYAKSQEARAGNARPRVVVIILGSAGTEGARSLPSEETVNGLTKLLSLVRRSGVRAVLLDVQIERTVARDSIEALKAELRERRGGNTVAIPLHVDAFGDQQNGPQLRDIWQAQRDALSELTKQSDLEYVQWVVPVIDAESDGVVRKVAPSACVLRPDDTWTIRPTLAFAVSQRPVPREDRSTSCPKWRPERQGIVYSSGETRTDRARTAAIPILSANEVLSDPSTASQLRDTVVVIGQFSWEDTHVTPLGPLPGVLVQANAVLTALEPLALSRPEGRLALLREIGEVLFVAAVLGFFPVVQWAILTVPFAFVNFTRRGFGRTKLREMPSIQWTLESDAHDRASWTAAGRAFIDFAAGLIAIALLCYGIWILLSWSQRDFAARQLAFGMVVGTFVPLLAVALEAWVDIAEYLVRFSRLSVEVAVRFLGRLLIRIGKFLGMEVR